MTGQRGYSLLELLVAVAVMLAATGSVATLLHGALAATPVLEETADLHQRGRVLADAIAADIRAAAAGPPGRVLGGSVAAAEPRATSDPPGFASSQVLTLRYGVPFGATADLAQPLGPGVMTVVLSSAGCPAGTIACGFSTGSRAVLLDDAAGAAFVSVQAIGPGVLTISDDPPGGRQVSFPAGATIAEATQVTYTFDAAARQIRRAEGGGDFVIADHVVDARFAYFAADASQLPLAIFQDGPFQGSGPLAFDVDLARVASVRAALRIETGIDRLRGTDPRLFARPGTAAGHLAVADLAWVVDAALRNGR